MFFILSKTKSDVLITLTILSIKVTAIRID